MNVFISNFSCGEILISICCTKPCRWILVIAQAVHFLLNHHLIFYRMDFRHFAFSWDSVMRESTTWFLSETSFYWMFRRQNPVKDGKNIAIAANYYANVWYVQSSFVCRKWNEWIQKYIYFAFDFLFGFSVCYFDSGNCSNDSLTSWI